MSRWRQFRDTGGVPSLVLATVFLACAVLMDVWPVDPLPYSAGQFIRNDIYARVHFTRLSPTGLAKAKDRETQLTPATFQLDSKLMDELMSALKALPERLKTTSQPADVEDLERKLKLDRGSLAAWQALARDGRLSQQYQKMLDDFQQALTTKNPIVADAEVDQQRARQPRGMMLAHDGKVTALDADDLNMMVRLSDSQAALKRVADDCFKGLTTSVSGAEGIIDGIASYVHNFLAPSPSVAARAMYNYDPITTQADIEKALRLIDKNPPVNAYDDYPRGKLLLSPRDNKQNTLGEDDIAVLEAEHRAFLADYTARHPLRGIEKVAGRATLLLAIVTLFGVYVTKYERNLVRNHWQGFAALATLLLMLAINKSVAFSVWNERVAILTVLTAGVVLTIAYNQRFALAASTFLALLSVLQVRGDLWQLIVLVSGAAAAVLMLKEIRSRSKLMEVGAAAAGVVFLMVCARGASQGLPWGVTLTGALWDAGAALLVGFLVWGILPLIERFYRVATSMTLLELCDASHPLLRRLAMDAPGTFNHSLQLGAMCEAAAEVIGARGLLARAGAYYHDIGKINKPEYFIENQADTPNPHAKLSPAMSLLIIIGHVKDGLELAREYALPSNLREFVTSHHGTTLVQYFYHAASEQRKADSERAPDEVEFRYPGPKPHSKEVAILMLADAAESSVRAMPDPTPGRIENQVHIMVTRRLMDGQLDECDLTLREVHLIEASLIRSLCGVYHGRIAYPKPTGQRAAPAEAVRNERTARNGKSVASIQPDATEEDDIHSDVRAAKGPADPAPTPDAADEETK